MTPAARLQTAIEILDTILAGQPAEQALTGWARRSRFAGSKDRAAVRDLVFDVLRARRSLAALGGAETGRGLVLGLCRRDGPDPAIAFDGSRYGPAKPTDTDPAPRDPVSQAEALDIPEWLWPEFQRSMGERAAAAARALQSRAPIHLRVNLRKTDVEQAITALSSEGIIGVAVPGVDTAIAITEGARKLRNSEVYKSGQVELQDASSQAVVAALPLRDGLRVLDYCAGGGGKALAIAARLDANVKVFAHDAAPRRMADLPERARRAGAQITCLTTDEVRKQAPFDVILTDVPCSGSGSWRRAPEGKWSLTEDRLQTLLATQAEILDGVSDLVAPDGVLAYATCSILNAENNEQIERFTSRFSSWSCDWRNQWAVDENGDGFFAVHLTRD